MVRAVDTGVVNVSNLNPHGGWRFCLLTRGHAQLSLAVQESADKLRKLADLESKSKGGQIPAHGTLNKP
jgi:hypothetical protein